MGIESDVMVALSLDASDDLMRLMRLMKWSALSVLSTRRLPGPAVQAGVQCDRWDGG